jgi:UDP-glucose 4-epimerase
MDIKGHILITGANGFVGRHVSNNLLAMNVKISELVHSSSSQISENQYVIDLTQREKVVNLFTFLQPDYVIHLAGSKNRINDTEQYRNIYDANVSMSLNIIDACRGIQNFKKLIFLGSCDEYGQTTAPYDENHKETPTTAYGLSKLAITQILTGLHQSHKFPSVVLRPSVIYGPGQGKEMFISALIQSLLADRSFAMTNGEQRRDFVYVSDVVDAIIKALSADELVNGVILNIGAGVSYQLKQVASMIAGFVGPDANCLIKFGAVPYRFNETMDYSVKITRAEKLLNWHPSTDIKNGLQHTVKYFYA